jgi:nucleoside-diphosphate-sugar epimerase
MQQSMPEDETFRVNTMGTFYVMDAARRLGVKMVAMASTFYVLALDFAIADLPFEVHYLPIDEDHPLEPESTYGLSKICGEEILAAFQRAYGIKTAAFRLMGVEYEHRPMRKYHDRPEARPGYVGGPRRTTWQYVEARDIAQACELFLKSGGFDQFEAFYLSTDTTLDEETAVVLKRTCPDLADMADVLKGHEGIISIKKAQDMLGYEPKHSWRNNPAESE